MIEAINRVFVSRANGRSVLAVAALAAAVFSLFLLWLVPAFQAATGGLYPIDMSFPTTVDVIYRELPAYTEESRRVYRQFVAVDFLWPPVLAALFATLWCWLARLTASDLPSRMIAGGVLLLPFAEALLDWTENVGFLTLIESFPNQLPTLAAVTGLVKHTKLFLYALCVLVTLMFVALAILRRRRG